MSGAEEAGTREGAEGNAGGVRVERRVRLLVEKVEELDLSDFPIRRVNHKGMDEAAEEFLWGDERTL